MICKYCLRDAPHTIDQLCNECSIKPKPKTKIPFAWEVLHMVGDDETSIGTFRAKVFGGWLIKCGDQIDGILSISLVFLDDPNHEWEIE